MFLARLFLKACLVQSVVSFALEADVTWTTVYTSEPSPYFSFQSVFFTGSDTGYAAGTRGILYKTVNGGIDWNPISSGVTASLNGIRFPSRDLGIAVGEGGLILGTSDGGKTWTPRVSGTTQDLKGVQFPTPETGYCVGDSGIVLKTEDAGMTWRILSTGFTPPSWTGLSLEGLYFLNADTGWVTSSHHILKTTDGGETWIGTHPPEANGIHSIWFLDPDTGFAVGGVGDVTGKMHMTLDGGRTWGLTDIPDGNWHLVIRFFRKQGYVASRPNGGSPTQMPIMRTQDGGQSWTPTWVGTRGGINDIQILDSLVAFAVGDYGKIFRTLDGGVTWASRLGGPSYNLQDIAFADAKRGFAVGGEGTLLQTDDGGNRWEHRVLPGFPNLRRIQFPTSRRGYIAVLPHILRTDDAGLTWDSLPLPKSPGFGSTYAFQFLNQDTGFYLIDSLYRTTDGGKTWMPISGEGMKFTKHIGFMDMETGFLSAQSDLSPYKTSDAGGTWTSISGGTRFHGPFAFPSARVGYAFHRDTIVKTEDAGKNWRVISQVVSAPTGLAFPTEEVGYILHRPPSQRFNLWRTADGGRSWIADSVPEVRDGPLSMALVNASTGFVVGNHSKILRFDAKIPAGMPESHPSVLGRLVRISGGIARLDLDGDAYVLADLHDIGGRRVSTLHAGRLSAGSHLLRAPQVAAPGIYLLRTRIGTNSRSFVWALP